MGESRRLFSAGTAWRGRWQRLSLLTDGARPDTTTRVTWLQTDLLYCDLRVPADRPAFGGCRSLLEIDDQGLWHLAEQQGFAGHLESAGDLCFWHRHIDFQPPGRLPDAAAVRVIGDRLVETGVFQTYVEEWRRCEGSDDDMIAAKLLIRGAAGEAAIRQGFLLAQGDAFMFALERRAPPERRPTLFENAFVRRERAALLEALDFEISLGTRRGGRFPWEVTLSTLPYLQGRSLLTERGWTAGPSDFAEIDRDVLRGRDHERVEYRRGPKFRWQ